MGRGAGACFSTEPDPSAAPAAPPAAPKPAPAQTEAAKEANGEMANKKVYIVYYSMYGHIGALAKAMKEGVDSVEGVEGELYQVAETLPEGVLEKMHAPPKPEDVPVLDPHDLKNADGFCFGFPTRFGTMAAQMKAFFDATGGHWQSGALVGKPATIFTSVATQAGGMETTVLTSLPVLAHHGMIIVPPGYSFGPKMFDMSTPKGGSAWGAGTLAGPDGSRKPSEDELAYATHQGKHLAEIVKKLSA